MAFKTAKYKKINNENMIKKTTKSAYSSYFNITLNRSSYRILTG